MATSSRHAREISPMEKKSKINISSNYTFGLPTVAPFGIEGNFPLEYEPESRSRRSISVFNKISPSELRHK